MISDYLNQTATWKQQTGSDPYAGGTYTSTSISVRWEFDRQLVRSAIGETDVSEAKVFTTARVSQGDVLVDADGREWPVMMVARVPNLEGLESHRELRL